MKNKLNHTSTTSNKPDIVNKYDDGSFFYNFFADSLLFIMGSFFIIGNYLANSNIWSVQQLCFIVFGILFWELLIYKRIVCNHYDPFLKKSLIEHAMSLMDTYDDIGSLFSRKKRMTLRINRALIYMCCILNPRYSKKLERMRIFNNFNFLEYRTRFEYYFSWMLIITFFLFFFFAILFGITYLYSKFL